MLRWVFLLCLSAGAVWSQPAIDLDALPLVNAAGLSESGHIILTVPLSPDTLDVDQAEALAARYDLQVAAIWPLLAIDVNCYVFAAPAGVDLDALSRTLEADSQVLTAHPIVQFETLADYTDNLLPIQHGLHELNALPVHAASTGSDVTVAVIDSGVATVHPDLTNQHIIYRDFIRPDPQGELAEPHGTAIAAVIAADARNGTGMVGVAPDVKLLALRACWADPGGPDLCNSFSIARALNFAILNKAEVINLSLGGPYDALIAQLINTALEAGILVVAAHGNGEKGQFPASMTGVVAAISAHSTSPADGPHAPGLEVISAKPGGSYDFFTGDSVAAAHVSGVAALLLATPGVDHHQVVAALDGLERATMLDACAALKALRPDYSLTCE